MFSEKVVEDLKLLKGHKFESKTGGLRFTDIKASNGMCACPIIVVAQIKGISNGLTI